MRPRWLGAPREQSAIGTAAEGRSEDHLDRQRPRGADADDHRLRPVVLEQQGGGDEVERIGESAHLGAPDAVRTLAAPRTRARLRRITQYAGAIRRKRFWR